MGFATAQSAAADAFISQYDAPATVPPVDHEGGGQVEGGHGQRKEGEQEIHRIRSRVSAEPSARRFALKHNPARMGPAPHPNQTGRTISNDREFGQAGAVAGAPLPVGTGRVRCCPSRVAEDLAAWDKLCASDRVMAPFMPR
jgi:hypothetical protein